MKQIMAVVSSEYRFSERFCDYVNKSGHILYTAVPFESVKKLETFRKDHNVPIILCDEEMLSGDMADTELYGVRTVPLCDSASGETGRKAVFKYQSAEAIVREIMGILGDVRFSAGIRISGRPVSVRSVYSPVSDEYKTYTALAVAACFARTRRTLYMNFEEFSGLMKMTACEDRRGLSEALFYMKQGELTPERIASLIYTLGPLQYIPPVRSADDLSVITGEDCVKLLKAIFAGSSYDVIIADLPSHLSLSAELLEVSEVIYMPVAEEKENVRIDAFTENLRLSEKDTVLEKIRRIRIREEDFPERAGCGQALMSSLMYGTAGDRVTEALRDEDN